MSLTDLQQRGSELIASRIYKLSELTGIPDDEFRELGFFSSSLSHEAGGEWQSIWLRYRGEQFGLYQNKDGWEVVTGSEVRPILYRSESARDLVAAFIAQIDLYKGT